MRSGFHDLETRCHTTPLWTQNEQSLNSEEVGKVLMHPWRCDRPVTASDMWPATKRKFKPWRLFMAAMCTSTVGKSNSPHPVFLSIQYVVFRCPPHHDESIWSVFRRRIKTPLDDYTSMHSLRFWFSVSLNIYHLSATDVERGTNFIQDSHPILRNPVLGEGRHCAHAITSTWMVSLSYSILSTSLRSFPRSFRLSLFTMMKTFGPCLRGGLRPRWMTTYSMHLFAFLIFLVFF